MNYQPGVGGLLTETMTAPRHMAVVRITHSIVVLSVAGLLVTGGGILVSHPRLYWGETGAIGTESRVDLALLSITGPSVWNPPIHFLFAWIAVLAGLTYVVAGFVTCHFRKHLLPAKADPTCNRVGSLISDPMRWKRPSPDESWAYHVAQRLIYPAVVSRCFRPLSGPVWRCRSASRWFSHGWRLRWAVTNPHVLFTSFLSACRSFISSSPSRCFAFSGSRVTCER